MNLKELLYDWNGLNVSLFLFFNGIDNNLLGQIMQIVSILGKYKMFVVYFPLVAALAWYDLGRKQSLSDYPAYRRRWKVCLLTLMLAYALMLCWLPFLKDYFHYPRPFVVLPEGSVRLFAEENANVSFPSGHAAFATLMVTGLWPVLSSTARGLAVLYLLGVMLSRMILGVHFPADLLGGFLLSAAGVTVARALVERLIPPAR